MTENRTFRDTHNLGQLLEHELRTISQRRKFANVTRPDEDIIWPCDRWDALWQQAQQQGGHGGQIPDETQPIIIKTQTFNLRIHCGTRHVREVIQ